jgi:TPR repeat protein
MSLVNTFSLIIYLLFSGIVTADTASLIQQAQQGDANAQVNIGTLYYQGLGVTQSYTEAAQWFELAANQGNAQGQFNLGNMYSQGQGVLQDYSAAVKWFQLAADQGIAEAQRNLGIMYQYGLSLPQNYELALKWFQMAASQGDAFGQSLLGTMYQYGLSVPQDYIEASKWFRLAATQGDAYGQALLGALYYQGQGVAQDYIETFKWSQLAGAQGNSNAQALLGTLYHEGHGIPTNDNLAVKWFQLAAAQGHAEAQFNLGTLYHNGQGISKDEVLGLMWMDIAAAQGESNATKYRNTYVIGMNAEQISAAQELTKACSAVNYKNCATLSINKVTKPVVIIPATKQSATPTVSVYKDKTLIDAALLIAIGLLVFYSLTFGLIGKNKTTTVIKTARWYGGIGAGLSITFQTMINKPLWTDAWLIEQLLWSIAFFTIGCALSIIKWHLFDKHKPESPPFRNASYEKANRAQSAPTNPFAHQENANQTIAFNDKLDALRSNALLCLQLLNLPANASSSQIKLAFKQKMSGCHPDKVTNLADKLKQVAEEETKLLNVAYQTLKKHGYLKA